MDARTEIKRAIFRELNSGRYGAFKNPPLNQPYPYITVSEVNKSTYDTKTTRGYQFSIFINCWSDSTSVTEVNEMASFVESKLLNKFEVSGFHNVKQDLTADNGSTVTEDNKELERINQEYTFIIIRKEEI